MLDQCGFDLGSGKSMTRDVDNVIDTTSDPVVAFVVTTCSVARELGELVEDLVLTPVDELT